MLQELECQQLEEILTKYADNADLALYCEFCRLKKLGLRKKSLQTLKEFILVIHKQPVAVQRALIFDLLATDSFIKVTPLVLYSIAVLEEWLPEDATNVELYYWLGMFKGDFTKFEQGLQINPQHLGCLTRMVSDLLGDVEHQMHHLGESYFIGHECDAQIALDNAKGYLDIHHNLPQYLYKEHQELQEMLYDWLIYNACERDNNEDFGIWCHEQSLNYTFPSVVYYKA